MAKSPINRNNLLTARALITRSLKDISVASGVDFWTLSDFEQGLQDLLSGEHSEAVERAMAGFGVRFEPDGSLAFDTSPAPPQLQASDPFRGIEAQDLADWGASRDGAGTGRPAHPGGGWASRGFSVSDRRQRPVRRVGRHLQHCDRPRQSA
jgi:hypothetical protein